MNNQIARECAHAEMAALQQLSYAELTKLVGNPHSKWADGSDGKKYQLEIQAFWDESKKGGNLRVVVSVDDGGWRAFFPLTETFILSPAGILL